MPDIVYACYHDCVKVDTEVDLKVTKGLNEKSILWSSFTFLRRATKKTPPKKTALKNVCVRAGEGGGGACSPTIQMFPIFNSACPTGLLGISELIQNIPPHSPD